MFRAVCALRYPTHSVAADTVGLVWPRVRIAPWFHDALDESARYAAIAHEDAHARHRDPLRIWLAQFVTDLQWPAPVATTRLARWRHELELSRDDEARRHGVEGADLAAAVVVAAMRPYLPRNAVAMLGTADFKLRERIERLLAPLPMQPVVTCWWRFMPLGIALFGALIVGICSGEHAIRLFIGGSR